MDLDKIEATAKQIIERNGSHTAQIILETDPAVIMMLIFDASGKEKMIKLIRSKLKTENIQSYIVIMEGWVGKNLNKQPSKDPERTEALIIQRFKKDLTSQNIYLPFTRRGKEIVWGERIYFDTAIEKDWNAKSSWNFYLEDVFIKSGPVDKQYRTRIDNFTIITILAICFALFMTILWEHQLDVNRNNIAVFKETAGYKDRQIVEYLSALKDCEYKMDTWINANVFNITVEKISNDTIQNTNPPISHCCYPKECEGLYNNTGCNPRCEYLVYCYTINAINGSKAKK